MSKQDEAKHKLHAIIDELTKGMCNEDAIYAISDLESSLEIRRIGLQEESQEE